MTNKLGDWFIMFPVSTYHIEGFFKLRDLILVEHGEDIGGRPLRSLLRRSTTGRRLSG